LRNYVAVSIHYIGWSGAPLSASVAAALTSGRSPGTRAAGEATSFRCSGLGACVGHLATSVTFTVVAAFFLLVAVETIVAAETGVPVATVVAAKTTVVAAETTVVAAETGVPVATAKTTVVAAKATVVAGIAPESFFVLPHSEGAAVRVAPGAVAVGAVARRNAVAGARP